MRNTFIAPLRRGFFLWYTSIYDHPDMRYIRGHFVVTGPDISPMLFKSTPRSQGLVQDSLSRLADNRDRGERSAYGAATEGA
jgi:hypothetical protein